jgi:hypothetical protein
VARQYQPKRFFRDAPKRLLQKYFSRLKVLADVDFGALTKTQVDPIYEGWLKLPEDTRNKIEQDFQEIDGLATESGSKAILDEARWHGEDLAGQFAALKSFHERTFWTFLERPKYWLGAAAFHHADAVPTSYWRKRKNLPRKAANVDPASIQTLEKNLSNYFHTTQGRGQNCKVDCYKRDSLDYFFAYPEDYAQANIEWGKDGLKPRPRRPAFEIIFVYSQNDTTLDMFLSGDRKPVPDLQAIFADAILKTGLGPNDKKDERVYDLNPLRSRNFQFTFAPESGIADVAVKKLRLKVHGKNERIVLEADPSHNRNAVFDLLDKVTKGIPLPQVAITQVGVTVTFTHSPSSRKSSTRSFDINWPNSCSLKNDGRDSIIRKMLADSGIEPREYAITEPAVEDSVTA